MEPILKALIIIPTICEIEIDIGIFINLKCDRIDPYTYTSRWCKRKDPKKYCPLKDARPVKGEGS